LVFHMIINLELNAMETHTLLKNWPIKPGVLIPKGTEVQLQAPYIGQLQKAGFIADPKANKLKESKKSKL